MRNDGYEDGDGAAEDIDEGLGNYELDGLPMLASV